MSARRLQAAMASLFSSVDLIAVKMPRSAQLDSVVPDEGHVCRLADATEQLNLGDCPGLRIISPSAEMQAAAHWHIERVIRMGIMSYNPAYMRRMEPTLYKWELLRLGREFNAILFSDLDVELLPSTVNVRAAAREWLSKLPSLIVRANHATHRPAQKKLRFLGFSDITSPFVASVFWVFPPADDALYREGVALLRAPWNGTHGWNLSGTPAQLARRDRDLLPFAEDDFGRGRRIDPKFDSGWDQIDGGDLDQGLYLFMLHYRHAAMAHTRGSSAHHIIHFNQNVRKPWTRALHYPAMKSAMKTTTLAPSDSRAPSWAPSSAPSAASRGDAGGTTSTPPIPLVTSTLSSCSWENLMRHAYLRAAGLMRLRTGGSATPCESAYHVVAEELRTSFNRTKCCEQFGHKAPVAIPGHQKLSVF